MNIDTCDIYKYINEALFFACNPWTDALFSLHAKMLKSIKFKL